MDNQSIPPSRPSTDSHAPITTPQGPIPLFDLHLKFLTDSYISFFQERKRIEETYIDSLFKLHRKARSIDAFLDDRSPNSQISLQSQFPHHDQLSTARSAWSEARDSLEREAYTRQAFLNTLSIDALSPLIALKESQERTRKRIKEDLKESSAWYQDYAESVLPKLKARYYKRSAEVDDIRGGSDNRKNGNPQFQGASTQANPYSNLSVVPPTTAPAYQSSYPMSPTTSLPPQPPSASTSNRPVVTSPQPLRALDRRPSGSTRPNPGGPRNRSPSASTPFADLAQQGKKQFNHLITFLDRDKSIKSSNKDKGEEGTFKDQFKDTLKDGLTAVRAMNVSSEAQALKLVKAKREAEDADREYRKGVHWLETLRLRKAKIVEAGFKSLGTFVEEEAQVVKKVLQRYADNIIATTSTQTQLYTHLHAVVDKVSPEMDVRQLTTRIPPLDAIVPEPILYEHAQVGECKDLLFGFSLSDYATEKGLRDGEIPKIVRMCIDEVDQRGLEMEGIYRVSGRLAVVKNLQHAIEKDESAFDFGKRNPRDDIYAVASLLKLYLRELPEPLFKFPLQDRIQHTEDIATHKSNNFPLLRSKLRRLPPVHQATLRALVEHLARVAAREEKNKMGKKNLAIVFGAVVFGEDDNLGGGDGAGSKDGDGPGSREGNAMDSKAMGQMLLEMSSWKDTLMEDMIAHAHILFSDEHAHPRTPRTEPANFISSPQATRASPTNLTIPLPNPHPLYSDTQAFNPAHSPNVSAAPLPPTPTDDPAPIAYGSKTTRVITQLPSSTLQRSHHHKTASTSNGHVDDHLPVQALSTPQKSANANTSGTEDFTPKVPSKPAGSIHPSARSGHRDGGGNNDMPPPLPVRPSQAHTHSRNPSTQSQNTPTPSLMTHVSSQSTQAATPISPTASISSNASHNSVTLPTSTGSSPSSPTPPLPLRPNQRRGNADETKKAIDSAIPSDDDKALDSLGVTDNVQPAEVKPVTPKTIHRPELPPERSPSADSEASWTSAVDTVSALDDDIFEGGSASKK